MHRRTIALLIAVAGFTTGANAQTDELFYSAGGAREMRVVQGGTIIRSWTIGQNIYTPAVDQTYVRTAPSQNNGVPPGVEYLHDGTPTGNQYPTPHALGGTLLDGTTDGRFNYATIDVNSNIYRFDLDWTNPQVFITNPWGSRGGITFDPRSGTYWAVEPDGNTRIREYDAGGNVLTEFTHGFSSSFKSIAYEPSTDTLWINSRDDSILRQFDKAGNNLQNITVNGLAGNAHGMEFAVPGPGSVALLALSGVAAGRRRR